MTAPTAIVSAELRTALKRLKLGYLIDVLPDRILLADKQQMSFDETLLVLLTDEISRRESTAATRRAEAAGLDPDMALERWDKTSKVRYDKRVFAELTSLRFIEAHRHIVVLG